MKRLRLRKIIAKIKKHPECWDQEVYHNDCGASHCIAGHCQIEAGKYIRGAYLSETQTRYDATRYLSLTNYQQNYLFKSKRTLSQIEAFEKSNGRVPK